MRNNMEKRRDLATFVLLAHLVSLLRGNDARDVDVILMGDADDAARASFEAKANQVTDELLENVTTILSEHGIGNFSKSRLATTKLSGLVDEEMKLEGELEEALEEIASAGRLVLISSPKVDDTNSTREIPMGSLILFENSLTTARSPTETDNEEGIDRSGSIYDQESAQSQTRARSSPVTYADREDIDNTEDLLAIAEYEPQKIDAIRIEATSTRNPLVESMRSPEETHYDVLRRRHVLKHTRRTNNLADEALSSNINPEGFSTRTPLGIPSRLDQSRANKEQTWFRSQFPDYTYQTGRNKSSLVSKLREKLSDDQQEELSRGSRHLKPSRPSSRTSQSLFFPQVSESLEEQLNYSRLNSDQIKKVTVIDKASKNKVAPRAIATQSLPVRVPGNEQNKVPVLSPKSYLSTVNSGLEKTDIRPSSDHQQLEFLTRYNMPSLLVPRLTTFRPYAPVSQRSISPEPSEVDNRKSPSSNSEDSGQADRIATRTRAVVGDSEEAAGYQLHGNNYRPSAKARLSKNTAELLSNPTITQTHQSYRNSEAREAPQVVSQSLKNYPGLLSQAIVRPSAGEVTKVTGPIHSSNGKVPAYGSDRQAPEELAAVSKLTNGKASRSPAAIKRLSKNRPQLGMPQGFHETSVDARQARRSSYVDSRNDPWTESNGAPLSLSQEGNKHEVDDESSGTDDYSLQSENAFGTSSSRAPHVNSQRTLIPTLRTASPARGENSDSKAEKRRVDGTWEILSAMPNHRELHPAGQQNNPPTSFAPPEYASYERAESAVEPAFKTSSNSSFAEPQSDNYGNRVEPLMLKVTEENLQPRVAYQTRPLGLPSQRKVAPRMKEESAESLSRADVVDREDREGEEIEETSVGSSHEENRQVSRKDGDADEEESESKGGGEKHEEGHHTEGSEKDEKGYKEWHEYDKGTKGHHDKESHDKEYDENKGDEKKHEDESSYHKEYHHGEKGNKESEFGEKGEHEKGHSTKGQHVVHKKDEYEKKTEFYDESHEDDEDEQEGGYRYEHENEKGGHEKIGHHDAAYHVDKHGERAKHEKARHWDESSGHDDKEGRERDHHHEERYGKAGAGEEAEKWSQRNGDNEKR